MVAICPVRQKKQAIIFLEVLRERTTFVVFSSSGNTQTVNCYLVFRSYECIPVSSSLTTLYTDFAVPNLIFFSISLHQLTRASFRTSVKLCGIHLEQIFLTAKYSCKIECINRRDAAFSKSAMGTSRSFSL